MILRALRTRRQTAGRSRSLLVLVSVPLMLCVAGAATFAALTRQSEDTIAQGVRFEGRDWSGKPLAEARADLEEFRRARLRSDVRVEVVPPGGKKIGWSVPCWRLGLELDIEATLRDALEVGRREGALARLASFFSARETVEIAPRWRLVEPTARQFLLGSVRKAVHQPSKDARLRPLETGGFAITPEKAGADLDVDGALQHLLDRLPWSGSEPLTLPTKVTQARIARQDLAAIDGVLAAFSTGYKERGNRRRNIELACSKMDGVVLLPGDTFSYNEVVGPRDEEYGFRMAPVIVKGRLVPGMGGGICQVSSTLYNAALLAGLEIVRRQHHAFPVSYLAPGRDATVVYGSIDFRFKNNTAAPVAISADSRGQRVRIRIFGKTVPGQSVRIERTNISSWGQGVQQVRDPSLPVGKTVVLDKGHAGHRVTVWRVVMRDGQVVRRERVSDDRYRAFPKIVAVGTGPAGPAASPTAGSSREPASPAAPSVSAAGAPPSQQ